MGDQFNRKAFLYVLSILIPIPIAVGLSISVPLALRGQGEIVSILQLAVLVCVGLLMSVVFSVLAGFYRYFGRRSIAAYRSIMRRLAKHAIRSSLRQAVTPMACVGIMEQNGTVNLKIKLSDSSAIGADDLLYVHEKVNGAVWGVVRVVELSDDCHAVCEPTDRVNRQFWEHLENRMGFDNSAPNVYLVRSTPSDYQRVAHVVENFLDEWR